MSVQTEKAPPTPTIIRNRVEWAAVPRVNLLPGEIIERRRFRKIQRGLLGVTLLVIALGVGGVVLAQFAVSQARADLAVTRAQADDLRSQQNRYAEVPTTLTQLDAARAARERAMATDVLWYQFLSSLAVNTPTNTELASVTIGLTGAATDTAAVVPLATAGLGEVKVTGSATRFTEVAGWLEAVNEVHGLAGSGLASATREGTTDSSISYTGSAVITTAALSHRYDRKAS